jgi:putative phosphoesterase
MLIGILSDTHDRFDMMRRAIELLQERGAGFFIHCGDVGSPNMLDLLAGLPSAFVFGNTDWDRPALQRSARQLGIECLGGGGELTIDEKRLFVTHGDDFALKQRILSAQNHDYLLQGHTHVLADERIGRTRLINPGALHRASRKTVALLDPSADRLEILDMPHAP